MESPRPSIWVWGWAALGVGGLVIAGLGALLYVSAWDSYVAANPHYIYEAANPPPASDAIGAKAFQATAMLTLGYVIALIASFMRLRSTRVGWMLVRAITALAPIPMYWLWLKRYFPIWASNVCGDCTPPSFARVPDAFALGSNVMAGAVVLGLILFVVFSALTIADFTRIRRRPADVPTP